MSPHFADVYRRICERYPSASRFEQQGGISMAVIPRAHVNPKWHLMIDDEEFRREVSEIIERLGIPRVNHKGDDAVLCLVAAQ